MLYLQIPYFSVFVLFIFFLQAHLYEKRKDFSLGSTVLGTLHGRVKYVHSLSVSLPCLVKIFPNNTPSEIT